MLARLIDIFQRRESDMNQKHSGKPMRFNLLLLGGCLATFQWSTAAHACLLPSGCVIAAGDTAGLIRALIEANATPEADTITLSAGTYIVSEVYYADNLGSPVHNGLPRIKSTVIIQGQGSDKTIIKRDSAIPFRFFTVTSIDGPGNLTLENLTLRGGDVSTVAPAATPPHESSWSGGAILNEGGTLTLNNVILDQNRAKDGGAIGSLYNGFDTANSAKTTLNNCILSNNEATTDDTGGIPGVIATHGDGGAILNIDSTLTINDSAIFANTSGRGAGVNNLGRGGAIANIRGNSGRPAQLALTNVTLSGNQSAGLGGGALFNQGTASLLNSTIHRNSSGQNSGGVHNQYGDITFTNTLLANASSANCYHDNGTTVSQGHNLDTDGSCALGGPGDQVNGNALLDPLLQNNGGTTPTHALREGSPAINRGDNMLCPATDQRGVPRPQDGYGHGNVICDIGAYELQPGMLILPAVADTYVRADLAIRENDNYGLQDFIMAGTGRSTANQPEGAPDRMRALLRFDLSVLPPLNLTGAVLNLQLHSYDNGRSNSRYLFDVSAAGSPWQEGNGFEFEFGGPRPPHAAAQLTDTDTAFGVAWTGAPQNTDPAAANNTTQPEITGPVLASQMIDQGVNRPGDIFQWDLTALVRQWQAAPSSNNGVVISDATTDNSFRGVRFGSREGERYALPGAVEGPRLALSWRPGDMAADFTGDGCIDRSDLALLLAVVRGQAFAGAALAARLDLNGDTNIDIADARKLTTLFSRPLGAPCH